MQTIIFGLAMMALATLDYVRAQSSVGYVIHALHFQIWTDVNAAGSTTVLQHWVPHDQVDQNGATFHQTRDLEGKDKKFEQVGEVLLWHAPKEPWWFRVVLNTGSDEKITEASHFILIHIFA
jgi:hypothetical protein